MGSLKRRIERLELEERSALARRAPSEEQEKQRWLATARVRLNHDKGDWHVRSTINLLRSQGRLGTTTEDLRERLLAWRPPLDRRIIEREIALAIYAQEAGTESMVCPPEWREAFEAADELRKRWMALEPEAIARIFVAADDLEGAVEEHLEEEHLDALAERLDAEFERQGLSLVEFQELERKSIGPDFDLLDEEERIQRLTTDILPDLYYSETGFHVQRHIDRIMEERSSSS